MGWERFNQVITVERISQYGVFAASEWFNMGKKSGLKPSQFEKGKSYDVSGYFSTEGKKQKFIDQFVPHGAAAPAPAPAPAPPPPPAAPAPAAHPAPLTRVIPADYTEKENQRMASIVVQAVMKSLLEGPNLTMLVTDTHPLDVVLEDQARKVLTVHDKLVAERLAG